MSVKISAVLRALPVAIDEVVGDGDFPDVVTAALDYALPIFTRNPADALLAAQVLEILEQLHADAGTRAACLRFMAWDALDEQESRVSWPVDLPASQQRLLDGQFAARQVWSLHARRASGHAVEGLRRLLLAIIGDIRVVFILLARQLVRMRQATELPDDQRHALASLTRDIHAPLANRLGVWQLKWELEDLSFRYLEPETYKRIARMLDERRADREQFIQLCIQQLGAELERVSIRGELAGRPKHIYSIWRKMKRKGLEFSDLHDIRAVRILVDDIPACYAALGVVHALWPYIPGEFDDYIARPKGNDYKSLHTAVHGPEGKVLEVQIRTRDMHRAAELGVAAHWRYKESGGSNKSGNAGFDARLAWLRQLLDESGDDAELMDDLRGELQEDRVYLLSPAGDVYDMAAGATVLDFAYHVHTEVGHRCRGAKVNGRIVPLTHQPRSGDRIEILTAKQAQPSRDWLLPSEQLLNTSRARSKVRTWFRQHDREANLAAGEALYDRELKRLDAGDVDLAELLQAFRYQTRDEFLVALALGEVSTRQVARALERQLRPPEPPSDPQPKPVGEPAEQSPGALKIAGVGNLLTHLARCCQPLPGDTVCGFITRGHGITVHRADCDALARLREQDADRIIEVEWGQAPDHAYRVDIEVQGYDRRGLQKDVTTTISNNTAQIIASTSRLQDDSAEVRMHYTVRVADFGQLSTLLTKINALPNVIDARRVGAG